MAINGDEEDKEIIRNMYESEIAEKSAGFRSYLAMVLAAMDSMEKFGRDNLFYLFYDLGREPTIYDMYMRELENKYGLGIR